jgi:hypothetical protein
MNKEKLQEIISDLVVREITSVCDTLSSQEFYNEVVDNYFDETSEDIGVDEENEDVHDMIGEKVLPFINLVSKYILDHHVIKK